MLREIVRNKDTVRCYLPHSRVVKVDRRAERGFPALLPERIHALARHYDISLGETRRIAGFDCQAVLLQPKDNLRYGYRLYADVGSGMLMRADTVDTTGATSSSSCSRSSASATSRATWCGRGTR